MSNRNAVSKVTGSAALRKQDHWRIPSEPRDSAVSPAPKVLAKLESHRYRKPFGIAACSTAAYLPKIEYREIAPGGFGSAQSLTALSYKSANEELSIVGIGTGGHPWNLVA